VTLTSAATVLLVPDVPAALEWFRDKLGFDVEPYEDGAAYGYANRDAVWFHLAACPAGQPNSAAYPPDMWDAYLHVDDLDALHAELVGRGAEIIQPPTDKGYGNRDFLVRDPHRYVIAFGQPLERPPDHSADDDG
jgi:predicted enzyme related to lactoylglutathione lyase